MNKLFTKIAALCLGATMAVGVGVAVASNTKASPVKADVGSAVRTCDFTAATTGNSNYGNTWNYASDFSVTGGANNNKSWAYCKFGGKGGSSTSSTQSLTSSVKTGPITNQIAKFSIVTNSLGTQSGVTVTSSYLYVYSDSGYSTQIDKVSLGTTYSGSGTLDATPTSGDYWAANSYYKWEITSTIKGKSNIGVCIDKLVWYQYTAPVQTYTVSFAVNTAGYGTLSSSSIANVPSGSGISVSNNTVTINGTTITATPTANTAQYTYAFSSWSNASGTITAARTITANFTRTTNTFTVSDSGISHGSLDSTAAIEYGGELDVNIVPDPGYSVPTSVSVTMGGNDISGDVQYEDGYLYYTPVTGNIVVTATCPASGNTYSISTSVTNGTYSGDTSITDNGGTASVTIAPTGDYKLPASVSVSGASHTYNQNTGVISLSNASGNVTISAEMVALTEYTIIVNETNGTHTGASTIKESRTASLTFIPASGYANPSSVTVSGATSTWTRDTGVLSLSNPTGNVTVTYVAAGNELTSITISANSGSYTLGDAFVKPTVTAHYSVAADANVTNSPNLDILNYDPYTTGSQSVTISYTEGGITKSQPYTATVSAKSIGHTYDKISSVSDITEGDYIMAYSTYAFNGADANNGYTTVSISGNSIAGTAANDKLALHITPVSGGYTLQVSSTSDNNASKYLGFTSGSNSLSMNDKAVTIASQTVSSSTHYTHASGGAFTFGDSSTVLSWNNNNGTLRFRFYKTSTTSNSTNGKNYYAVDLYKKVTSGSASLIRITATYNGGEKYVGDSISTSDFTVKKQLNTGDNLIDVASGYTISANTLSSTSNTITVSYTENNITKTAYVVVPATERTVTLESVTLVQGQGVVKEYIDWSGAAWDYTGLTVDRTWSDASVEHLSLADLITAGDATVSPAKPASGITSFTVSYEYLEVSITNATVSGITVVEDYVTSIAWNGTHAEHFKAFSGSQLTAAQVGSWSVVPTLAGAGVQSALSFGQYTLKVGNKTIASLPYTWTSEDDGQELSITYGKDENGDDFVKKNNTAVGNICASINAIDHSETISGDIEKTATWTKAQSVAIYDNGSNTTELCVNGVDIDANIHMQGDSTAGGTPIRFWSDGIRCYKGNKLTFTPKNGAVITKITFASTGISFADGVTDNTSSPFTINEDYGDSAITLSFSLSSTVKMGSDVVVEYTISGSETTTVHYANDMNHFDAQKKVVEFAKFMNDTMNGTNVCSGTFANLESAWDEVADKYDKLFGASTTLDATELAWAKNMLQYASPVWGSDAEAACVEKAMKTYDYCVETYGLDEFLDGVRTVGRHPGINPIAIATGDSTSTIAIIVIISMISVTTIGGYFFLRKRKEN